MSADDSKQLSVAELLARNAAQGASPPASGGGGRRRRSGRGLSVNDLTGENAAVRPNSHAAPSAEPEPPAYQPEPAPAYEPPASYQPAPYPPPGPAEPRNLIRMVVANPNPRIGYGGLVEVVDA
ncbi:hypothetical protein ACWDWR_16560, partial [Nocardia sp. NPDC003354]